MKEKTRILLWRMGLLAGMALLSGVCLWQVNQHYDPLARYPYATDQNREDLLEYFSAADIDYVITQQLKPEQFMTWLKEPGFDVRNTVYYETAEQTQPDTPANIVQFVNRYKSLLSLDSMESLLKAYSYEDLQAFFDSGSGLKLVDDPENPYVMLTDKTTVYHYVPDGLVSAADVYLHPEAAKALEQLLATHEKVFETPLEVKYGYLSYDELNRLHEKEPSIPGGGQNELQLGWMVEFALPEAEEEQATQEWLTENAWRYGFVQRFADNPSLWRYVGEDKARQIRSGSLRLEDLT